MAEGSNPLEPPGPHVLVELDSLEPLLAPIKSATRVKYTCFDVSPHFLVCGTSSGAVMFFHNPSLEFLTTLANKEGALTHLALSPDENYIAFATSKGHVAVFSHRATAGTPQRVQYEPSTASPPRKITCLHWSPTSLRVYIGDSQGRVAAMSISSRVKKVFQPGAPLLRLDSAVVQIDSVQSHLLVSTLTRAGLWDVNKEQFVQVGRKLRDGEFGACLYPAAQNQPGCCLVFCARPGSRLWEADMNCNVHRTHQFKQALAIPSVPIFSFRETDIATPAPPSPKSESFAQLQLLWPREGKHPFILTWSPSGIFVFNPLTSQVVLWNDRLTGFKSLRVLQHHIFVLQTGDLRKYSVLAAEDAAAQLYARQYYLQAAHCLLTHPAHFDLTGDLRSALSSEGHVDLACRLGQVLRKPAPPSEPIRLTSGIYLVNPRHCRSAESSGAEAWHQEQLSASRSMSSLAAANNNAPPSVPAPRIVLEDSIDSNFNPNLEEKEIKEKDLNNLVSPFDTTSDNTETPDLATTELASPENNENVIITNCGDELDNAKLVVKIEGGIEKEKNIEEIMAIIPDLISVIPTYDSVEDDPGAYMSDQTLNGINAEKSARYNQAICNDEEVTTSDVPPVEVSSGSSSQSLDLAAGIRNQENLQVGTSENGEVLSPEGGSRPLAERLALDQLVKNEDSGENHCNLVSPPTLISNGDLLTPDPSPGEKILNTRQHHPPARREQEDLDQYLASLYEDSPYSLLNLSMYGGILPPGMDLFRPSDLSDNMLEDLVKLKDSIASSVSTHTRGMMKTLKDLASSSSKTKDILALARQQFSPGLSTPPLSGGSPPDSTPTDLPPELPAKNPILLSWVEGAVDLSALEQLTFLTSNHIKDPAVLYSPTELETKLLAWVDRLWECQRSVLVHLESKAEFAAQFGSPPSSVMFVYDPLGLSGPLQAEVGELAAMCHQLGLWGHSGLPAEEDTADAKSAQFLQHFHHLLDPHRIWADLVRQARPCFLSWNILLRCAAALSQGDSFDLALAAGETGEALRLLEQTNWQPLTLLSHLLRLFPQLPTPCTKICLQCSHQVSPLDVLYLTRATNCQPSFLDYISSLLKSQPPALRPELLLKVLGGEELRWAWLEAWLETETHPSLACFCGAPRPGAHRWPWSQPWHAVRPLLAGLDSTRAGKLFLRHSYWPGVLWLQRGDPDILQTVVQLADLELLSPHHPYGYVPEGTEGWSKVLQLVCRQLHRPGQLTCTSCGQGHPGECGLPWDGLAHLLLGTLGPAASLPLLMAHCSSLLPGSLPSSVVRAALLGPALAARQSNLALRALTALEHYQWTRRATVVSPEIYQCFRKKGSIPETLSQTMFLEEPEGHWGVTVDLSQPCPACGLPVTGPSPGSQLQAFPCGHLFHQACLPQGFCPLCQLRL